MQVAAASYEVLQKLRERRLEERFVAIMIDGKEFAGMSIIAALGVTEAAKKQLLGIRGGATENSEVVTALLGQLQVRGLNTTQPTLFVIDGAGALRKASLAAAAH
jgi:putative transposase